MAGLVGKPRRWIGMSKVQVWQEGNTGVSAIVRHSNGRRVSALRVEIMHKAPGSLLLAIGLVLFSPQARAQQIPAETPQGMLAAQIRTQGFTCEKPLGAKKNTRLSRPDRDVWVLKCSNAKYRITRAPDMAAKVERLP
ncbi:hypothetical protein [Bradyrhizobium sp. 27S5]|uniref:hypothetical protein n=1 Tax=Bradyrhizobium sp. 27S5 TaxID=3139728 RepID=UPI0030CB25D3